MNIVANTLRLLVPATSILHEFSSILNPWLLTDWPKLPSSDDTAEAIIPPLVKVLTVAALEPALTLLYDCVPIPPWMLFMGLSGSYFAGTFSVFMFIEGVWNSEPRRLAKTTPKQLGSATSITPKASLPAGTTRWPRFHLFLHVCMLALLNAVLVLFSHSIIILDTPDTYFFSSLSFAIFLVCRIPDLLLFTWRPQSKVIQRERWSRMAMHQCILVVTRAGTRVLLGQMPFPAVQAPSRAHAMVIFGEDRYRWLDRLIGPPWLTWAGTAVSCVLTAVSIHYMRAASREYADCTQ